jgi:hypothetical protein
MTFKMERVPSPDGFVVFRVSGRIDGTYASCQIHLRIQASPLCNSIHD